MTDEEITEIFMYHAPKANQPYLYESIRQQGRDFAHWLNTNIPDSREKSVAITKIQEAVMFANAAVAIHGQ